MTYEIDDPVSGQRVVFHEAHPEALEVDLYVSPGAYVRDHFHPSQHETFTAVEGTFYPDVDGKRRTVGPGESMTVPPGVKHGFRAAPEAVHLQVTITPALRLELYFRAFLGLSRDRKLTIPPGGFPQPLLQMAVILDEFAPEIAVPGIPLFLQRLGLRLVAPLGRLKGYRSHLPEYGVF
jgi:quercetin dioxygenase-like cupin family protein